jgi:hypothetical protein
MIRANVFRRYGRHGELVDESVLVRCADRLWRASEFGRAATDEEWEINDIFTPSWVSPVYRSELGPALMVDIGGDGPDIMADFMQQIVVEELERAGVTDAEVTPWPPNWQPSNDGW